VVGGPPKPPISLFLGVLGALEQPPK